MRLSSLPPDSSKVTTTSVPCADSRGRFHQEISVTHAPAKLAPGVVSVVIHVGGVERIGDQTLACILREEVVGLARIDADHAVAPLLLHLAEAEEGHVAAGIVTSSSRATCCAEKVPGASAVGKFLRILFEVEAGGDQAIGDRLCARRRLESSPACRRGSVRGDGCRSRFPRPSPDNSDRTDETGHGSW